MAQRSPGIPRNAELLKEHHEESNPCKNLCNVYSDLMSASLSEVNWTEIAESLLEDTGMKSRNRCSKTRINLAPRVVTAGAVKNA